MLLDAVADVTGIPETFSTAITDGATVGQAPAGTRAIQLRDPDTSSRASWSYTGAPIAAPFRSGTTSRISSQAMHVLAGATYVDRLSDAEQPPGETARNRGAADEQIFKEFYLAALSRPPAADELQD